MLRAALQRATDPHQFDLRPQRGGAVLDVGCGGNKVPGAVGLDISPDTDADVVHDLDVTPYPFEDSSFDEILLQDVIEHVERPMQVFAELHRIGRPGARVVLRTPHFSSVLAYSDPTHRHAFSTVAIRQLATPLWEHYSGARFAIRSIELDLWLPFRVLGVQAFANRRTDVYERYLAFRFPAMNIRAEFEVVKEAGG